MSRYFLDQLRSAEDKKKISEGTFGDGFEADDARRAVWADERAKYGFDGRDTWALDHTMIEMLYERVMMFKEKASVIVNLEFHKFDFNGETFTELQMIDELLENAEFYLRFENNSLPELDKDWETMTDEEINKDLDEYGKLEDQSVAAKAKVWLIWSLIENSMWW